MKKLLSTLLLLSSVMWSQSKTTVTGVVTDAAGPATSGTVVFTLQPQNTGIIYYIAGTGIIAPQTATCGIDGTGHIMSNTNLANPCQIWGTDLIIPANLTYQVTFFPNDVFSNAVSQLCITGATYDLSNPKFCPVIRPTPQFATVITSPIQNNLIPSADGVFTLGTSALRYSNLFSLNGSFTNFTILNTLTVGSITASGNLSVGGNTLITGTLGVTGSSVLGTTQTGALTTTGNINAGSNSVTAGAGVFSGVITSSVATGTAPFSIASTTMVPNLNCSLLLGGTWAIPGTIGSATPNTGAFTSLNTSGTATLSSSVLIGGVIDITETSAPIGGVASKERLWGDSTAHRLKHSDNNGSFVTYANTSGDTFTNTTLTSPVINGSPTGTGIPTITFKKGTNAGNYTTSSLTFAQVDGTNLSYTVTIPTGWKLTIVAAGASQIATATASTNIAIVDGGSTIIQETLIDFTAITKWVPWSLAGEINGDGASHTVDLRHLTSNGADAVSIANTTGFFPTMVFTLSPSN